MAVPQEAQEIASVDRAIAALESQRGVLGDAVVDTALAPLRARRDELAAPRGEQRRLVTVVFADLVDFTVLSRQLDPEDTRDVIGVYFARWQRAIEEQGGVVEKFIGDAVMAVFGLSRSFEDDAHRAIRAALRMLAELDDLNAEIEPRYGVRLHLRVGIDTGEVVVSTLGERGSDFVAVGPTVNRAARLEAAAPVDRVLISAETQRQVRGAFGIDVRHGLELKGIEEPVDAFVVVSERRLGFRLDPAAGVEGVETTTVGREPQLRLLQDRLRDVTEESRWRVVTILGEAGVGKSRLLFDFDEWLVSLPETFWWFRGRATPSSQNSVNALLRDLLSSRLDIQVDDPREVVRTRFLEGFTTSLGAETGHHHALLVAAWLGFDVAEDSEDTGWLPTDPQALRDQGTEALGEYFRGLAAQAPVAILLEDLHWADEGTLRWLDAAHPLLAQTPVFVVGTARPALLETHPHWGEGLAHHVRLPLAPLSGRESRELVLQILHRVRDLPEGLLALVIDNAEGNPFYIEELTTWLIDAGVVVRGEPDWFVVEQLVHSVAVPSTLKGVLQSRLDALTVEERTLLQRASVVGRVFWDQAVAYLDDLAGDEDTGTAPVPHDDPALRSLEGLRRRELLLQREVSAFASAREYLFKHALLRDVAYDGVLRRHRERYHRRAAGWLAATSASVGRQDEYAALIAEHLAKAHDPAAAAWYLRAGRRAMSVYALREATRMLDSALELVDAEDAALTFDVRAAREELFDRVGERETQQHDVEAMTALGDRVDVPRQVQLQLALSRWQFLRSAYDQARDYATRAVELADETERQDLLAEATLWRGKALTWADDDTDARECLTRAVELARAAGKALVLGEALRYLSMLAGNVGDYPTSLDYAAQAREVFARAGDTEMEGTALAQSATTYFSLGRYAEAQDALEETLPIFRRSGHRYREAINLGNLAAIAQMRGHLAAAERFGRQALEITEQLEEVEASATYRLVIGTVEAFTSRLADARADLEAALRVTREVGATPAEVDALTQLVAVELADGRPEVALERARQAVAEAVDVPSDLDRGHAHQCLGYAASATGHDEEAGTAFAAARALFVDLELDALVREATAGLAGVASGRGAHAEAVHLLEQVLPHLDTEGLSGTQLPGLMLRSCHRVLESAGDGRAADVLERARGYLVAMAEETGDPDLAAGYRAFPPHAELLGEG